MKAAMLASAAVLATASLAAADTVTMNFVGAGQGRTATIRVDGDRYTVHAGQLVHDVTARSGPSGPGLGLLTTYCVDVAEWVSYQSRAYDVNELTDAPVAHGNAGMDQHKADAIGRLYTYANGQQYGSSNNFAAAFQIAIWEVVSDLDTATTTLSVSNGDFRAWNLNGGTTDFLDTLLGVAVDDGIGISDRVLALTNDGSQDQMFEVAVPLPTTGAMAAVGLAGAGFFGRRRRA
ncbi:MAG: hypothetical protein RIE77_05965 [Phycisphaerales bacterium]|jgi:hypothetical protein